MSENLRGYQVEGINKGKVCLDTDGHGFYLGDEMGLGKSRQAIELTERDIYTLVVCPKNAVGVWEAEFRKWKSGTPIYQYTGSSHLRGKSYDIFRERGNGSVLIATYSLLPQLLKTIESRRRKYQMTFGSVIFDEIHRLRNRRTQGYLAAKHIQAFQRIGLSGSPIVNRPDDLWAPLSILSPKEFTSYWSFVDKHLVRIDNDYGVEVGGFKNPESARESIAPYFLRRTKQNVAKDLPEKQRVPIYLEMLPAQARLYRQMWRHMYAEFSRGLVLAPSVLAKITRLRQILVDPSLLSDDSEVDKETPSAVLQALPEWIQPIIDGGNQLNALTPRGYGGKVVIFTPFVEAFGAIQDSIESVVPKLLVQTISGRLSARQVTEAIRDFQEGSAQAIIVSIRGATSFSLTAASHAFFVGYDWTPATNAQAEDRLHRLGQHSPVTAYYFIHKGTFDEHILKILDGKTTWAAEAIDPYKLSGISRESTVSS